MNKTIYFIVAVALVITGSFVVAGCGSSTKNMAMVGSTSVQPLAQELADAYEKANPGVKIDVQGVGSTAGVNAAHDKTADIGMSSRELTAAEKQWKMQEVVLALDGISVVVNPANQTVDLSVEQIRKIFKGEITNWKQVGGKDAPILVVSREAGSGTRTAFEELTKVAVKKDGKEISLLKADALIADGNGSVQANVAAKDNAIGYMSMGMVDKAVKALKVEGVQATDANVVAKKYSLSRPFILLVNGEASEAVKAFLKFSTSPEAKKIIGKHYIPVE
ncbi:MAG: phosphate ABC transporter substrate-binding protein [Negativicutes bacterium]|jgi:phosphate transport system substrate-binding protein